MAKHSKSAAVSTLALAAILLGTTPSAAQEAVPQCGGLDATIIHTTDPDPTDGDSRWYVQGTEQADVIIVSMTQLPDQPRLSAFVNGGAGDDVICTFTSERGTVVVTGGEGDDTILIGGSSQGHFKMNMAIGGPGNDVLHGGPYGDLLDGGEGDDTLYAYQGDDMLGGGSGDDVINAGQGLDFVSAGEDDDTVFGGPGNDFLYGGFGRDILFGGAGHDQLFSKDDFVGFAEDGFEPVNWENPPPGPIGMATMTSFSEDTAGSRMFGGTGSDLLVGSNRWDRMQGGAGDDFMLGMEGRDWMRGGPGDDTILGGLGIDDINGNVGQDDIVVLGQDIGQGGFGQDTCFSNGTTQVNLRSCEAAGTLGPEWNDLYGRINEARFEIEGELQWRTFLHETGTCISADVTSSDPLSEISCDEPHDYEVYRQAIIDSMINEYNAEALEEYAETVCSESLAAYLPTDDDRNIQFASVVPSRNNWIGLYGEPQRLVTCVLFSANGEPLVGFAA